MWFLPLSVSFRMNKTRRGWSLHLRVNLII
jgi:hypothetical protein